MPRGRYYRFMGEGPELRRHMVEVVLTREQEATLRRIAKSERKTLAQFMKFRLACALAAAAKWEEVEP